MDASGHGEDGLFDLGRDPVWMRAAGTGQAVDQPFGAIGLEVPADLVELLAGISHHPAGPADIAEIGRQFEQAELATGYFLLRGHVRPRSGGDVARNSIKPAQRRHGHTGPARGRCGSICQVITLSAHTFNWHLIVPAKLVISL